MLGVAEVCGEKGLVIRFLQRNHPGCIGVPKNIATKENYSS